VRFAVLILAVASLLAWTGSAAALVSEREPAAVAPAPDETPKAVESLALYPEDTRDAILGVSLYPQLVAAAGELQAEISGEFQELLADLPREEQQKLWELVRFPELVDALAAGERKSDSEIRELAKDYSEEIRTAAEQLGRDRYELLREIRGLRRRAELAVDALLRGYPLEAQGDFRKLLERPEILSLLHQNPELTRRLGDRYRRDPTATKQLLTELGRDAEERNREALDEWVRELEEDPEAEAELRQAAEEFAVDQEIDPDQVALSEPVTTRVEVVHHYYGYAYPYWFGYPYWYSYGWWYPRPYYAHWGFYLDPVGAMVVVGLPSYAFVDWHFRHRHHHHRYSHLSARYVSHARRHRRWRGRGDEPVRAWVDRNRRRLPEGWLRGDGQLARRFRDYGQSAGVSEPRRGDGSNSEGASEPRRGDGSNSRSRREESGQASRDRSGGVSNPERDVRRERRAGRIERGTGENRRQQSVFRGSAAERQHSQRARSNHRGSGSRPQRHQGSRGTGRRGRGGR